MLEYTIAKMTIKVKYKISQSGKLSMENIDFEFQDNIAT